ncbi:pyridoxal phosphate-dependent aminotransferase [Sphingomonas sp.]|uniref:pyridoxal phosphate-dependent aminotransferase n=1 Tax=Sphingomonas sp. TaxID=28214 RepID=UPI0038A0E4B1
MTIALSRRSLLGAASAGTAAALAGVPSIAAQKAPPLFGPASGTAWLTYNENPYGPSPKAMAAMADAASKGCYYADEATERLRRMIAERFGVTPGQVVIGNGSTEVLSAAALDWGRRGPIVCPELFFDEPLQVAERHGARLIRVPLRPDMSVDLDAMAAAAAANKAAMIYLCNPNNPTAMLIEPDVLRAFALRLPAGTTLLVDEAYNELTDRPQANSMLDLVKSGRDVIVSRTFSKIYGLAGLRIGYVLTTPENAQRIDGNIMTIDLGTSALAAAIASLNDEAFMAFSKNRILEGRGMILEAARKAGADVLPSQANFVFVRVPDANAVRARMAERGIIIRGAYGKWKNWSRVSTGKIEDVRRYAAALPATLGT